MNTRLGIAMATLAISTVIGAWSPLKAQCPLYLDPTTTRLQAGDLTDQSIIDTKFAARQSATTQSNLCSTPLVEIDSCSGKPDLGEGFAARVFARLASGNAASQAEAITAMTNLKRSDLPDFMGSTVYESGCHFSDFFLSPILGTLLSDVKRAGEADVSMLVLMTALNYGLNHNPPLFSQSDDVVTNVLSLIDLKPGPGSVETLSFGFNTPVVCGAVCLATTPLDPACLGCLVAVPQLNILSPETENHLNNIYTSQYLANQLLFKRTGNPQYENARNGYKTLLVNRLKNFVHHDFIEYNSRPYQDYTMFSLLTLFSYAEDADVKTAAKMVLDYVSAKVAASSNDVRRSTPFRRKNDSQYFCSDLLNPGCADPQTAFFMMLTGVTDILPNNKADSYGVEFAWASTTDYRVDHSILDLFVNRSHRNFYQFFHYTNTGTNDELYFGSPSYLISAGGHPNKNAYAKDLPSPVDLIASLPIDDLLKILGINATPFADGQLVDPSGDDLGVAVPTTLMPTGDGITSRDKLIQFYDSGNENLCVWRNFACGLNPVIPPNYTAIDPGPTSNPPPGMGTWTFYDQSGGSVGQKAGFYAAVYQQDGFGFLQVYDTWSNPQMLASLNAFANAVFGNNVGATFSKTNPNNYKTVAGSVIQFQADAKIITVDGKPPYDPNRTNGDIIDDNGQGLVTIKNPALGTTLTLDATIPPSQPQITVPGPLTFADTCVGATSTATLNVCNDGTGSDGLFVYNILSQNKQFQVTEPSSEYPTTVGTSFCFPFQAQFTPAMTGAISSNLTISSSDTAVPYLNVKVNGNGIQQGIATVIASAGNFGNVCIGSFADLNLTINNTGGCDLSISGITGSGDFKVASTLAYPLIIHAGGSIAVPIRFQPSGLGPAAGTITVASNDPNHASQSIAVSGNVPAPMINASIANNGSFGNVCAGTQSDLTLQVINQGLCPLTISSIMTPAGTSFALPSATTFPVVLASSGSINLPIRFQPAAFGTAGYMTCSSTTPQASTVTIKSDDPKYTGGFPIAVNGIEGCPKLTLSPQNLTGAFAFPPTVSDPSGSLGCYTDRQITIGNSGICPLYVTNLTAGPSNTFNVTNPSVPLTIAPGAAPVPATIRFRPTNLTGQLSNAPDQQTGTLTIVSNDPLAGDNAAGLCGEPVYHSGIRALVVNATGQPINPLRSLSLASKGLKPNISQTLSPATPATAANICGNSITYTLDNETLPPAGTTGNNPNASYTLSAKQGSTAATMSFTLGQCEFKQPILQIR